MKKIVVIYLLLFSVTVFAQAPKRFYTKFGGSGIDIGYSAKPTLDRHYIVAGSTSSFGAGNTDVYLVKVDSMGFPIWQKTFGGFNNDVGRSVIQLADSGYVVAGYTNSFGAGGYDAYIVKTDKNGNFIWQKTFGGLDWDFAYDLVLAADGDIVVCGNTSSLGAGKKDGLLLKYDTFGALVWQKTIGGAENEELRSVIKTNDNFLATVGYTESNGDIDGDVYFYKFDLSGNTIFYNITGGPGKDYANDIRQKVNSDYVICGAKTYSVNGKTESFMFSISSTSSFIWENHYSDNPNADEEFMSTTSVGYHPTYTAYLKNRVKPLFKLQESIFMDNDLGNYYKVTEDGGAEDELCYSMESTSDGGFISVGVTHSFGALNGDVYFLKRDSTLINNLSVVGLYENKIGNAKPLLKYLTEDQVEIFSNTDLLIKQYRLISLNGDVLFENSISNASIKIDLSSYVKSILILEIKLSNGDYYRYKIKNG